MVMITGLKSVPATPGRLMRRFRFVAKDSSYLISILNQSSRSLRSEASQVASESSIHCRAMPINTGAEPFSRKYRKCEDPASATAANRLR